MKGKKATSSESVPALPTISALHHLEPRPGGQWAVTEQSNDSYSLAYLMDDGHNSICYTIHPCTTEEEIRNRCGSLIYDVNASEVNFLPTSNKEFAAQQIMVEEKVDVEPSAYHNDLIDPRIMMCGSQNSSTTIETQPYFEVSHATPTICNSGYDQEYNQIFTRDTNCSMVWTIPRGIASDMNPMVQISDGLNTECAREEDAVVTDLWDEELRRMEPPDENSGQPEWQFQFVPFS